MNRAERRALKKGKGSHAHTLDCGCSGMVNLVADLVCPECGEIFHWDVWLPSSGLVGEYRQVGTFCGDCDADLEGMALITDRVEV